VADFYTQAATMEGMSTDMVDMSQQIATLLTQSGEHSNLLGALVNSSLLHMPSLLAGNAPVAQRLIIEVQSPLAALLLLIAFSLLGVLIGVIYMDMLARTLPIGDSPKPMRFGEFVAMILHHWVMVLFYVALMIVAVVIGLIPITLTIALFSLISPAIGSLILMLLGGIFVVVFFYLTFVTPALILDNLPVHRAIVQSFVLVRNNFWATLGFVMLNNVIALGFALLLAGLAQMTPIGTIAAILLYAYIGTGLTMALLVFYRTRLLKHEEGLVPAA
jgi:hypothetical protein